MARKVLYCQFLLGNILALYNADLISGISDWKHEKCLWYIVKYVVMIREHVKKVLSLTEMIHWYYNPPSLVWHISDNFGRMFFFMNTRKPDKYRLIDVHNGFCWSYMNFLRQEDLWLVVYSYLYRKPFLPYSWINWFNVKNVVSDFLLVKAKEG